jgi:hypothetical protein
MTKGTIMSTVSSTPSEWVTYDELEGPELDPSLWAPLDFGAGPMIEPDARTTVENGTVTVDIPRFTVADVSNQGLDNSKHVIFTTQTFRIPADGIARFSAELRSEVRDESGDYRMGFASFNVVDPATHRVFNILSTGERVFAEQELLPGHPEDAPFTRVIEDPFFFSRRGIHPTGEFLRCTTVIDRSRGQVLYTVDDEILHVAGGLTDLPEQVNMALGIFTLMPVDEGVSSAHGQGGRASWRNVRYGLIG